MNVEAIQDQEEGTAAATAGTGRKNPHRKKSRSRSKKKPPKESNRKKPLTATLTTENIAALFEKGYIQVTLTTLPGKPKLKLIVDKLKDFEDSDIANLKDAKRALNDTIRDLVESVEEEDDDEEEDFEDDDGEEEYDDDDDEDEDD